LSLSDLILALSKEQAALVDEFDEAATEEDRRRVFLRHRDESPAAAALLAAARLKPADPVALLSLATLAAQLPFSHAGQEAAQLISADHLGDESLDSIFDVLSRSESDLALEILRAAYQSSPHLQVKWRAGFALAIALKTRAERRGWLDLSASRADLAAAESLFEETVVRCADLRYGRVNLADLARIELVEIRLLTVGRLAPEIVGEDVNGEPMRLSDHRGKVVVLSFWGNWCSLCRSMLPYERALVERMSGRPIVFLGVNSDAEVEVARSLEKKRSVTWRSWKDGGELHGGAIARRWNVQGLPDIFILDEGGVIRHHVGPRGDDHGPVYFLDALGNIQHRWQSRADQVLDVAEALVREVEGRAAGGTAARVAPPGG
jgi:thiol-disulfide isomerase/thioredoxin